MRINRPSTSPPPFAPVFLAFLALSACEAIEAEDKQSVALTFADKELLRDPDVVPVPRIPWQFDPNDCQEEEVSRPPDSGFCQIEITWNSTTFVTGQGVAEGRGEISSTISVHSNSGTSAASSAERKFSVGQTHNEGIVVQEISVATGSEEKIEICADFVEHDKGLNGHDDDAHVCQEVTVRCDPQVGTQMRSAELGPADFCGPQVCLGSASANVSVIRKDADGDGVPNMEDFTPNPCDEVGKGQQGVALLLYYHYGDDDFTTFFQSAGTNISRHFSSYDYVALVMDSDSNPVGTSGKAFKRADIVFEPTQDGLIDAMRHLTAEGYRFDAFFHSHGSRDGALDTEIETLDNTPALTGASLLSLTEPNRIGTPRGGIPIVAFWGTVCWSARLIDVWQSMGAVVSSGAIHWNMFPTSWMPFWSDWVGGTQYRRSVDDSVTPWVEFTSNALMVAQSALPLYFCDVDDLTDSPASACITNFFNDGIGWSEAQYDLDAVFDASVSGADNMHLSSERHFQGDETAVFGDGTWP